MALEGNRWRDALAGLAALAAAWALYGRTVAPTVLMGDSGEFQFAAYLLGIAHPTGYPLYLLLGWAWSHLVPLGDVAYRMNLFSALWGAMAIGLLVPTLRLALEQLDDGLPKGLHLAIAWASALALATSATFWSQALVAEVYSLNSFLVVLILYLLLRWSASGDGRWLYGLALAYGLGLAHHRSILLLAPGTLLFLWLAGRLRRQDARRLPLGWALLILPLCLYLYIPWRAPNTPYLTLNLGSGKDITLYQNTIHGALDFILGRTFEGAIDLGGLSGSGLAMAWRFTLRQFSFAGPFWAGIGIGYLAYRRRWGMLSLTLSFFVALLLFCLVYRIGDIHDLFTPLYIVLALWIAVGASALARGLKLAGRRWGATISWAAALVTGLLPVWLAATQFGEMDRSGQFQVRRAWEAILSQPIPQGAILVSNDRNEIMPMWYLQLVEGVRPDLKGVFPLLTASPEHANVVRLIDSLLGGERPIYLIKPMPGLEVKYRLTGEQLVRVEGMALADGPTWQTKGAMLDETMKLVAYRTQPSEIRGGETLEVAIHWQPLRALDVAYTSYVHLVDESGHTAAQSDHRPGGEYYPTSLWQPGEALLDSHVLSIPRHIPSGTYRLEAGMYAQPGLRPLGERVFLGTVQAR